MIVYASRTGNVRYVINKLALPSIKIEKNLIVREDFILFTYVDRLGCIPEQVLEFLNDNHDNIKGVICSGNSNFGVENFCKPADIISKKYGVPILAKLELRGYVKDYMSIREKYFEILGGK